MNLAAMYLGGMNLAGLNLAPNPRPRSGPSALLIGLMGLLSPAALAQGNIVVGERVRLPDRSTATPMDLRSQNIHVEITDGVAVTRVAQKFFNPLERPIEGQYVFPLPDGVAVGDFSMTVAGKTLEGEVLERDKARRIYEDVVRRTRDPGLLEFLGSRLYRTSVFPIPGRSDVEVQISYSQSLIEQNGLGTYQLPLRAVGCPAGRVEQMSVLIKLRSSQPLTSVFCPTHSCEVQRPSDREAIVSYEAAPAFPERDLALYYQRADAQYGLSLLTCKPAGEDGYFLLRVAPRVASDEDEPLAKDIAFVIDTSGSMKGDKIEQARRALRFAIQSLGPRDRFSILTFSTGVRAFRDELIPAGEKAKSDALLFADAIEANGGTNIHGALLAALEQDPRDRSRPYLIVFMTDGKPTVDETRPERILANVQERNRGGDSIVRCHVLGVGSDVNTHLLDKLAEATRGSRDYCTEKEDLEVKLSAFVLRLANPVLTDLKLSFAGARDYDVYPKDLSDLFRGSDLVVLGRYSDPGRHEVTLTGRVERERRSFRFDGDFTASPGTNDFLPRLWAHRKVAYLLDELRLHGESRELIDEIVRLATRHGIVTPYTSSLIVEDSAALGLPAAAPPAGVLFRRLAESHSRGAVGRGFAPPGVVRGAVGQEAVEASRELERAKQAGALGDDRRDDEKKETGIRRVGAKTFVLDAQRDRYLDTAWDGTQAPRQVEAFSAAYFELIQAHEELTRYLSLGDHIVVELAGFVYEIVPPTREEP